MINQISRIDSFGIFRAFNGIELPPFKKRNLIYGWNYSGKTTLSRLIQSFEFPEKPIPFPDSDYQILLEDQSCLSASNRASSLRIRVFNREFVQSNFYQEHTAPAVAIIGEENADLRKRLDSLEQLIQKADERSEQCQNKQREIQNKFDESYSSQARYIRETLGVTNFRKPELVTRVREIRNGNPETHLLNEQQVAAKLGSFRTTESFQSISSIQIRLPEIGEIVERVQDLLSRTASKDAIASLEDNRDLERWVHRGLELHENQDTCQFCGSAIRPERRTRLQGHFSQAYRQLLNDLDGMLKELQQFTLEGPGLQANQFHPGVRQRAEGELMNLNDWMSWAKRIIDELQQLLIAKQTRIEDNLNWRGDLVRANDGFKIVESLNATIVEHERLVGNIENTRTQARRALERHYAARHFIDAKIAEGEDEINNWNRRIQRTAMARRRLNDWAQNVRSRINEKAIGTTRMADLMRFLLKDSNLSVERLDEGEFRFVRDVQPAENLSEGEKTAITFAYFLTTLEADGEDLSNTVVFVDDPVSSLDSNHIYAIYALLSEKLENARQLFLSTHNHDLFNLIKERWFNLRSQFNDTSGSAAYLVRRMQSDGGDWTSIIETLPSLLRRFKSEYYFIFLQLYRFANQTPGTITDHEAYTAPNLLRKFLEAYLGFKKPCVQSWSKKLDLLFDNPEQQREIQKFADDASHLQSLNRVIQQPEYVSNAQNSVHAVLRALEGKDRSYFESLCRACNIDC